MTRGLQRRSAPLVIDLGGRDVSMAKQILDLGNIDTEIEQPGGTCCPQTMWRVDALAVGFFLRLHTLQRRGIHIMCGEGPIATLPSLPQ